MVSSKNNVITRERRRKLPRLRLDRPVPCLLNNVYQPAKAIRARRGDLSVVIISRLIRINARLITSSTHTIKPQREHCQHISGVPFDAMRNSNTPANLLLHHVTRVTSERLVSTPQDLRARAILRGVARLVAVRRTVGRTVLRRLL